MELQKITETIVVCDNQNIVLFHMDTTVATVFCYHSSLPPLPQGEGTAKFSLLYHLNSET